MIDRISESRARYEDLSVQLADPNIHADPKRMRELSREHSRLAQIVEAAARLDRARVELAGAQEMLAEGADDAEMVAMAREEAQAPDRTDILYLRPATLATFSNRNARRSFSARPRNCQRTSGWSSVSRQTSRSMRKSLPRLSNVVMYSLRLG